ncbi:Uncharacterised protein [Moraxella ovis]|nr:hypothetical protein [Moraxella ovis]STZ31376.1 Uncharacterised protein [Moraxella ovis]
MMFADMDVAVIGKVMPALNEDFDRYWASERAYPANAIIPDDTKPAAISAEPINTQATKQYIDELRQSDYASKLIYHTVEFYWTDARLISDNPMRVDEDWEDTVTSQIAPYFQKANSTLTIVSPYFVPTDGGVVLFNNIARDTDVKILTNSLAANDVAAVHSGYAKYRKPLLNGNVGLYELKTEAAPLIQKKNQGLGVAIEVAVVQVFMLRLLLSMSVIYSSARTISIRVLRYTTLRWGLFLMCQRWQPSRSVRFVRACPTWHIS